MSDDGVDGLVHNLRDLTQRNGELEDALLVANKKLAFYEGQDELVQDAMGHSLRIAFQIRSTAESEAAEILQLARREEALIRQQLSRLASERDGLIAARDTLLKAVAAQMVAVEHDVMLAERGALYKAIEGRKLAEERDVLLADRDMLHKAIEEATQKLKGSALPGDSRDARELEDLMEDHDLSLPIGVTFPLPADLPAPRIAETSALPPRPGQSGLPSPLSRPSDDLIAEVTVLESRLLSIRADLEATAAVAETAQLGNRDSQRPLPEHVADGGLPGEEFERETSICRDDQAREKVPVPQENGVREEWCEIAAIPPTDGLAHVGLPDNGQLPGIERLAEVIEVAVSAVPSFPKLVELQRTIICLPEVKSSYVRNMQSGVANLLIKLTLPQHPSEFVTKLERLTGRNVHLLDCPQD